MRRSRALQMAALLGAVSLAAAACGGDEGDGGGDSDVTVGIGLTDAGTGDFSFNDAAATGALALEDAGYATQVTTPKKGQEEANLKLLADAGNNPIVAIGFSYETSLNAVAPQYADTDFAIVDSSAVNQPNVTGLVFSEEQGSYLVGALAAKLSKTGNVGFIGAQNIPLLQKFAAGYKAGAEQAAKDLGKTVTVQIQWIGTGNETFSSPDKAQVIADSMIQKGADVLYHAAGGSGAGMFNACAAQTKWCIGVDSDQYAQYEATQPDVAKQIITSMVKRVEVAVEEWATAAIGGDAQGGTTITYDLARDGVGYSDANSALTADDKAFMDGYKEKIVAGDITVPATL